MFASATGLSQPQVWRSLETAGSKAPPGSAPRPPASRRCSPQAANRSDRTPVCSAQAAQWAAPFVQPFTWGCPEVPFFWGGRVPLFPLFFLLNQPTSSCFAFLLGRVPVFNRTYRGIESESIGFLRTVVQEVVHRLYCICRNEMEENMLSLVYTKMSTPKGKEEIR